MNNQSGFTLVELSLVMIVIGLLIGGTFAGMTLIDNMKINATVQQLKNIESAAIKFKDAYGLLPGDIRDPATVLSGCTAAPCTTAGNGDGKLDISLARPDAITNVRERFTFWHHLSAANMIDNIQPTTSMEFGEGQPTTALDIGLRMMYEGVLLKHGSMFTNTPSAAVAYAPEDLMLNGKILQALEAKIDDGKPHQGKIWAYNACYIGPGWTPATEYDYTASSCGAWYLYNF